MFTVASGGSRKGALRSTFFLDDGYIYIKKKFTLQGKISGGTRAHPDTP